MAGFPPSLGWTLHGRPVKCCVVESVGISILSRHVSGDCSASHSFVCTVGGADFKLTKTDLVILNLGGICFFGKTAIDFPTPRQLL